MRYALCTVPAAPVRKEDAHRTEMVNQLLFGEALEILEEKGEWFRIRSLYDDYEGWLTHHLVTEVDENTARAEVNWVVGNLVSTAKLKDQFMNLPMGSPLPGFDPESTTLWNRDYHYLGFARRAEPGELSGITETASLWLNAPYLCGGKTLMGVDCSGFVQTIFRCNGIRLKRDAWQQAEQGKEISLEDSRRSDLAFFHNEKGKIVHVGILLGNQQIIHAAGKVRIDKLDKDGIINSDNGKRTHQLHSTRRYF